MIRYLADRRPGGAPRPALFLDRDGVLNEELPNTYVLGVDSLRCSGVAIAACHVAMQREIPIVVVTNQGVVGRELVSPADLMRIHARLLDFLGEHSIVLEAIYACPHHPDAPRPCMRTCSCRKPSPGMLLAAADDLRLDLPASAMIGNRSTDRAAALAAGIPIRNIVLLGQAPFQTDRPTLGDFVARHLERTFSPAD